MKRTFFLGTLLCMAVTMMAQQPVITFSKTEHDFGKINEEDGRVSTIFEFKNEGMEPLVLSNVRASCGCTTPTWTRTPIEPGQTGNITVTYNPNGRPGKFSKTITVTSNAATPTSKLRIFGEVIPKQAKPVNRYNVTMGDLSLKTTTMTFGTIYKGNNVTRSLEYANLTDHDVTVEILQNDRDQMLTPVLSLKTLKPKEVGTLNVNFDTDKSKLWGPNTFYLYMMVNGKRIISDEYKITLSADIEEDFGQLSVEEKQSAPIFEMQSRDINLGSVKAGGKLSQKVSFKNVGERPLEIRHITNYNPEVIHTSAARTTVKGGKTGTFLIEVLPNAEVVNPGMYRRQVEILTNDPKNTRVRLTTVWSVVE